MANTIHKKSGEHINTRIQNLEKLKKKVIHKLTGEEEEVLKLIQKAKTTKEKIRELHENLVVQMKKAHDQIEVDVSDSKKVYKKFGAKYEQMKRINTLLNDLRREVNFLEHELKDLIQKEQELKYHQPKRGEGDGSELLETFKEVSAKLDEFEKGVSELNEMEKSLFEQK